MVSSRWKGSSTPRPATRCGRVWTSSCKASTSRCAHRVRRRRPETCPGRMVPGIPATRSASSSSPERSTLPARCAKPKAMSINKVGHALHDLDPVFATFLAQPSLRRGRRCDRAGPAAAAAVDVHLQAAADRRRGVLPSGQHLSAHRADELHRASGWRWRTPRRPTVACGRSPAAIAGRCARDFVREGRRTRMETLDPAAAAGRRPDAPCRPPRAP